MGNLTAITGPTAISLNNQVVGPQTGLAGGSSYRPNDTGGGFLKKLNGLGN